MSDDETRARARKRAEEKVGFFVHFGIYLAVNGFLATLWWFTGGLSVFPWFIFPLFGWGIGLVAHFMGAFVAYGTFVDRMTERELRRLRKA